MRPFGGAAGVGKVVGFAVVDPVVVGVVTAGSGAVGRGAVAVAAVVGEGGTVAVAPGGDEPSPKAIATAAPAIATTSVSSETQTQSPGYHPSRREPGAAKRREAFPVSDRQAQSAFDAVLLAGLALGAAARAPAVPWPGSPLPAWPRDQPWTITGVLAVGERAGWDVEQAAAVRAEVRPAQHRGAAAAAGDAAVGMQKLVDLGQPRVDADELGAALGEQVLAEAAAPVELDQQPAEVAQLLLADVQERALLSPQQAGVGPARGDPVDSRSGAARGLLVERPQACPECTARGRLVIIAAVGREIKRVGVVGFGTMGAGIHCASPVDR